MNGPRQTAARVVPFGERAWLVELGTHIDLALNGRVHAMVARLDGRRGETTGLGRAVPGYASLLVPFDPAVVDADELRAELLALADEIVASPVSKPGRLVEMQVRYGGVAGPDLEDVAARTGLSVDEVIAVHSGATYRVFMLGFAPGFAYLGTLPRVLQLPRRDEPRLQIPARSVAIAAAQTAVYPHATAGGWHLLGQTDVVLWDGAARPPSRLQPGDNVRFVPA